MSLLGPRGVGGSVPSQRVKLSELRGVLSQEFVSFPPYVRTRGQLV